METNLQPIQRQYVSNILECAKTISDLITNLLEFSAIQSSKLKLKKELFQIRNVIQFLKSLFNKITHEKQIDLQFEVIENQDNNENTKEKNENKEKKKEKEEENGEKGNTEDTEEEIEDDNWCWGDWLRFQQICINLTTNAIKYTNSKVKVVFEMTKSSTQVIENENNDQKPKYSKIEKKKWKIKLIVKDDGIGIEKHEIYKIFEPFYQVERNTTGFGVGLYIVSEIVKEMKGKNKNILFIF